MHIASSGKGYSYNFYSEHSKESFSSNIMAEGSGDVVENLDAINIDCRCPCGNTNFQHILDPPPVCLARRHTDIERFPKLDLQTGRDSETAKEAMRQHLLDQTEVLKKEFVDYTLQVYNYAQSVNGMKPRLVQIIRRSGQNMDVNAASSFDELYEAATGGLGGDSLHYEPFECIVEQCNYLSRNEQTRERIAADNATTRYMAAFERFAKLRTFSFDIPLPIPEGVIIPTLRIKVEESIRQLDFKRVKQFQRLVREILHLDERVLFRVADVQEGCVEITYKIIGKVSKEQFNLKYIQKKALASNNITMLEYAGHVYYCCCHLMPGDEETIRQLYRTSVKDKPSSPVGSSALEKDEHFPDCSYIQGVGEMCPMEKCTYCGKMFHFCFIEFHVNKCGESARLKFIEVSVESSQKFTPTLRNHYKEPVATSFLHTTYPMDSMQHAR